MSDFLLVQDFIILKSEIVSVQYNFKPMLHTHIDPIAITLIELDKNKKYTQFKYRCGEFNIVIILKDGSYRVVTKKLAALREFLTIKESIIQQLIPPTPPVENQKLSAENSKPNICKTTTITTRRRIPIYP